MEWCHISSALNSMGEAFILFVSPDVGEGKEKRMSIYILISCPISPYPFIAQYCEKHFFPVGVRVASQFP